MATLATISGQEHSLTLPSMWIALMSGHLPVVFVLADANSLASIGGRCGVG